MSVKQKCPEFENHERWLVSYADMLTLLFAVFVVLYSQALEKLKAANVAPVSDKVAASIQESFKIPMQEIPAEKKDGPDQQGWGVFDHMKGNQMHPSVRSFQGPPQRIKQIEGEMDRTRMKLEDRLYGPHIHRDAKKAGQERIVNVQRTKNGFKLQLTARHFFTAGETQVRREALRELEQVAAILKDLGRPITIEGHTDSIPSAGTFSNWELSSLRAANVAKYFVRNAQFPVTKLSIAGYADTKPIASNSTESGRSLNRRIEIHVQYDIDATADTPE